MEQQRVPHPTTACKHCAGYFAQLGQRDAEIRDLRKAANDVRRAQEQLAEATRTLDALGAPTKAATGWPLTLAGRIGRLVRSEEVA